MGVCYYRIGQGDSCHHSLYLTLLQVIQTYKSPADASLEQKPLNLSTFFFLLLRLFLRCLFLPFFLASYHPVKNPPEQFPQMISPDYPLRYLPHMH